MVWPLFIAGVLAAAAFAQPVEWRGPVSGILFDVPSKALRPVMGVPGGSYLGAPVMEGLDWASVSPSGDSAIVSQGGRLAVVAGLRGSARQSLAFDAAPKLDLTAWAANSRVVIAYSADSRQVLRIEPGSMETLAALEAPGEVKAIAVNQDGSSALLAVSGDDGGYYAMTGGSVRKVHSLAAPGALAYHKPANTFYALEGASGRIQRISASTFELLEPLTMTDPLGAMTEPLGLAVSHDSKLIFIAGGADRSVRAYDFESRSLVSEMPLSVAPDRLTEVSAATSVFVLAARQKKEDAVWLLDARSTPSVFFVPGE